MAKIIAPNKLYAGESAGIQFSNGEAETDNKWLIQWFKENGYTVEEESEEDAKDDESKDEESKDENPDDDAKDLEDEKDDLKDKNMDQLKELADEKEVEYNANIKKADLIDLLRK